MLTLEEFVKSYKAKYGYNITVLGTASNTKCEKISDNLSDEEFRTNYPSTITVKGRHPLDERCIIFVPMLGWCEFIEPVSNNSKLYEETREDDRHIKHNGKIFDALTGNEVFGIIETEHMNSPVYISAQDGLTTNSCMLRLLNVIGSNISMQEGVFEETVAGFDYADNNIMIFNIDKCSVKAPNHKTINREEHLNVPANYRGEQNFEVTNSLYISHENIGRDKESWTVVQPTPEATVNGGVAIIQRAVYRCESKIYPILAGVEKPPVAYDPSTHTITTPDQRTITNNDGDGK